MGRGWFYAAVAAAGVAIMDAGLGATATGIAGQWGAPGVSLTIGPEESVLERSCGRVLVERIRPDPAGRFVARARIEEYRPGPQQADADPALADGRVTGLLAGDVLTLTITSRGAPPERLRLERGRRGKVIRCL